MSAPAPWATHFGLKRTPVRHVDRRQGPLRPPGPRRRRRPHQLLRRGVRPRRDHRRRRRRQDRVGARRRRRPRPHPPPDHLHRQPRLRHPRPLRHHRAVPRRRTPLPQSRAHGPSRRLLAAEAAQRHRRVVLVCDEAHLLDPAQLEELRLLTNSEMDSASPFAGILIGQPTLNRQLRMGIFAPLDQRIATRFTIKPMDLGESADYLRHHLALAGRDDPLFADDAVAQLHRASSGLPRALNNAATAAIIAGAADNKDLVDDACANKAVAELTRD